MFAPTPLQVPGPDSLFNNPLLQYLIIWLPWLLLIFYGQRLQTFMILGEVGRSLNRLKVMREAGRKDAIEYVKGGSPEGKDHTDEVDRLLDYFTIPPVDLDPAGIVRKIEHIYLSAEDRLRAEVSSLLKGGDERKITAGMNIMEAASTLNLIYKIVRHFYLLGRRTSNIYILIQLQVVMPQLLEAAGALVSAIDAFKLMQPIGDGIGPLVIGKMMLGLQRTVVEKETVLSQSNYKGRVVYYMKAEGPGGTVGRPGTAVAKLVDDMGVRLSSIIMIDAALKLEGEKTGEVAEGIGAAIGGIGVDRFKIEEAATKYKIPLYAVVIKESIIEAISVMRREIAEARDKVVEAVQRLLEEKTKEGDNVLVVGVGNTLGVF